ncbi:RimJ/RimL family protein N-acetyltransferase [Tumebacillus algifaecis]|uniref:RimJ/RimL family protein N-acetyltransferase n=1 Tax=Tumebacillus algifaecis TaxID=1214604 RepID=A0A223D516_9BACL|nr:GNAT family protein [Tumebacillus algifaecis]ASS76444.1 RimJ/RimL family protein N-acetyltransferase [Tumebacillus algifaecis]
MLKHVLFEGAELRLLEEFHAEEFFRLTDANREHLREWLPFVDGVQAVENTLGFIKMGREQYANNQGTHYGIFYEGQLAGVIGYHFIDWSNRGTSIGYWLGRSFTGRGLMTAAVKALVDQAFQEYQLNRVEIRVATGNVKSQAIPERLGFVKEGVLRQREWMYDRWLDHVVYSMLASEWAGQ